MTNQYLSVQGTTVQQKSSAPVKEEEEEEEDDDDDIDLFGSEEDEEAEKLKEQRLKEYAEKKAKKPAIIAKSSILLDVKPVWLPSDSLLSLSGGSETGLINSYSKFDTDWQWAPLSCCSIISPLLFQWDDETDMAKLEECVRSVQADGLLWGTSKLVPVGYGIKKLQITCVVEDDKVGTDMLEEEITKFEDYVSTVQYTELKCYCKGHIQHRPTEQENIWIYCDGDTYILTDVKARYLSQHCEYTWICCNWVQDKMI